MTLMTKYYISAPVGTFSLFNTQYITDEPVTKPEDQHEVMVSDASEDVCFVYEADEFTTHHEYRLTNEERGFSSSHRELLSLTKFFQEKKHQLNQKLGPVIYWITNSKNVTIFLKKGSRIPTIQSDIIDLKLLEREMRLQIIPVWSPRNKQAIVWADLGSKNHLSSDEWGLDQASYHKVMYNLGVTPEFDMCATDKLRKCPRFVSYYPQTKCIGVNIFSMILTPNVVYYCCPPVRIIVDMIRFIISKKNVVVILVIPLWKSQAFWTKIVNGKNFSPWVSDFHIFPACFITSNKASARIFNKHAKFKMLAIKIETSNSKNSIEFPLKN